MNPILIVAQEEGMDEPTLSMPWPLARSWAQLSWWEGILVGQSNVERGKEGELHPLWEWIFSSPAFSVQITHLCRVLVLGLDHHYWVFPSWLWGFWECFLTLCYLDTSVPWKGEDTIPEGNHSGYRCFQSTSWLLVTLGIFNLESISDLLSAPTADFWLPWFWKRITSRSEELWNHRATGRRCISVGCGKWW